MMKHTLISSFVALSFATAAHADPNTRAGSERSQVSGQASIQQIQDWSKTSKKAAQAMLQKYGEPDEMTESMWLWTDTGPWKKTIVYKEAVDHDFPIPHKDVLEQFIDYQAPEEKYDDIARFDGSVILERTKGEMSARCDKEAANLLAVNLANDVATGEKSVDEARKEYGEAIKQFMEGGKKARYMQELAFEPARGKANDSDIAIVQVSGQGQ